MSTDQFSDVEEGTAKSVGPPADEVDNTTPLLTRKQVILWGLVFGIVLELITVLLRFNLGLQITRDTHAIAYFTFGLRIHHGYIGALLIGVMLCCQQNVRWRNFFLICGIALVSSDFFHHFLVLWPITGSPEFDFVYPS